MDADVIIIGSGPAGGMSACTLAGSMRVLLIERYKLPREKLCSGVVTPKTAVQLAGVIDLQSVLIGESHRFWMGLRGRGKEFEHDPPLLFASRPRMDLALVEAAAARGADVIEGAAVASVDPEAGTVTLRDGRRLAARVVIGADGAAGVARRAVDPAPAVRGFAMEVRIPDPRGAGDRPSIADFGVPHGFLWAYPKRDGTLAIGGGTAHRSMPELPDIVRAFARQRFGVSLPDRIPGHLIPFRPARRVKRGKVLLVLVDVSKTGMVAPTPACAQHLKARFPDHVEVLVDASQFRIGRLTLRAYLEAGFWVAVTGSKFLTGPAFSGALLIPESSGRILSADQGGNIGLLLRWEAAIAELRAFAAVSEAAVENFLSRFADTVQKRLAEDSRLEPLPVPGLSRPHPGWDTVQTIFPFRLKTQDGGFLCLEEAKRIHALLSEDMSRGAAHDIAAFRCNLGQPVACGALRLCSSSRLVVDSVENGNTVVKKAFLALDKAIWLMDHP